MTETTPSLRIDIWLWRARFFKTRSHAASASESGQLRLERFNKISRIEKSSTAIKPGDRLIFPLGAKLIDIMIEDIGERRGPPSEARTLYKEAFDAPDNKPNA